jgi:hypothetical protein
MYAFALLRHLLLATITVGRIDQDAVMPQGTSCAVGGQFRVPAGDLIPVVQVSA